MIDRLKTFLKVSAALVLAMCAALSCRTRSGGHPAFLEGEAYTSSLTAADTLSLTSMADNCMSLLVAGEYGRALACVGYAEDGVLQGLTPEMVSGVASSFGSLGVRSFERSGLELVSSQENTVRYRLLIGGPAPSSASADPRNAAPSADGSSSVSALPEPSTVFAFNAYRIDGRWYLSLKR